MSKIEILDLKPLGHYADGTLYYKFHNPFPGKPITLPEIFATPQEARDHGKKYVLEYEQRSFPGGMGAFLGIIQNDIGYQAVINTYYSNS